MSGRNNSGIPGVNGSKSSKIWALLNILQGCCLPTRTVTRRLNSRHRCWAPSRWPQSWCSCRSWRCRGRCWWGAWCRRARQMRCRGRSASRDSRILQGGGRALNSWQYCIFIKSKKEKIVENDQWSGIQLAIFPLQTFWFFSKSWSHTKIKYSNKG